MAHRRGLCETKANICLVCRYTATYTSTASLAAKYLLPAVYAPHHVHTDPADALWVRRHLDRSHAVAAANHSWAEV